MPLYNKENDVQRAIASIFVQKYKNWELIIINDGSTDKSMQIIEHIKDPRIIKIDQVNQGVSVARNNGILKAKNEYICFLDADDTWEDKFLEKMSEMISQYPDAKIWATSYYIVRGAIDKKKPAKTNGINLPHKGYLQNYFSLASISDPLLWTGSLCVKRGAINDAGLFPKGIVSGEDLITWAKIVAKSTLAWNSKPLANFYAPLIATDRTGRKPQTPDLVSQELQLLINSCDKQHRKGLKSYLYMWHKNRANTSLQLNDKKLCLQELQKMIRYSPFHRKNFLYLFALCLPKGILKKMLKK